MSARGRKHPMRNIIALIIILRAVAPCAAATTATEGYVELRVRTAAVGSTQHVATVAASLSNQITTAVASLPPATILINPSNSNQWVEFRGREAWFYSVVIQKVLTFSSDFIDPQSGQTLYPQSFVWPFTSNGYKYLTGDGTTPSWIFSQFNGYASIYSPSQTSQWDGLISNGTLSPSGGGIGSAYLSTQTTTNLSVYRLGSFVLQDIATNVTWEIVASNGFFEVKAQ